MRFILHYKSPKYRGRQAWSNSVDPDQTSQNAVSDQDLHGLSFMQQILDTSTGSEMDLYN